MTEIQVVDLMDNHFMVTHNSTTPAASEELSS